MAAKGVKKTKTATKKKISGFYSAACHAGLLPQAGKEAVEGSYRAQIQVSRDSAFTGSVDIDSHFRAAEPQSHRWDYGIGVQLTNGQDLVCWVEPHPASSTGQVSKMLAKLAWLKSKLDTPAFKKLKAMTHASGHTGSSYYWLRTASGQCRITANSREAKLLALHGLRMPTQQVTLP